MIFKGRPISVTALFLLLDLPVLGFRTILDVERFVTEHTAATGQLKSAAQTERPGPERVGPAARWPHLRP